MANSQTIILKRLIELNNLLEQGKLDQFELEELVQLAQELHEKCIILRYKAIEQNVYAKKQKTTTKPQNAAENRAEITAESDISVKKETSAQEIDFSIFDTAEDETKNVQMNSAELSEKSAESTDNLSTENSQEQKQASILEALEQEKYDSFNERFASKEENSLIDKISAAKIETLKGAFGLNEKLQVIQELFNADADLFNTTIEILDTQDSKENAKQKLSEIAVANAWDLELSIVEDFVRKVERRYV